MFELNPRKRTPEDDAEREARRLIEKYQNLFDAEQTPETRALPAGLEHRQYSVAEIRESSGGKRILRGYGAKWNTLSADLGGFREMLSANCFSRCLARPNRDLRLLFNHDWGAVLAREKPGTFKVEEDSIGLKFRAELAKTHLADDVFSDIQRGNLAGCSFAMRVRDGGDAWSECEADPDCEQADDDDDRSRRVPLRIVNAADIYEISVVALPAYAATTVTADARSLFPAGVPRSFPLELRSRLISLGAPGELTLDQQRELRVRMRLAALEARL
jgi:uncharacterized protein